jgi:hypothetical protein
LVADGRSERGHRSVVVVRENLDDAIESVG